LSEKDFAAAAKQYQADLNAPIRTASRFRAAQSDCVGTTIEDFYHAKHEPPHRQLPLRPAPASVTFGPAVTER
jgi:hypothetical protein